mmetsp:Transcript_3040/g.3446  ORF Transcript_3040/g.3446 Transcript_3040/m.3446 type:complete len:316 (-) Transcript_3040:9-956(-)
MAPIPLRVEVSGPDFPLGEKLIFDTGELDEMVRNYREQCRAEMRSKTLQELQEIRQEAEVSIQRGVVRYRAAQEMSRQKMETCGAPGRLEALKRDLRHWKLLLEGADEDDFRRMNAKLQSDREILQQIHGEQSVKELSQEQKERRLQALAEQIQGLDSKIAEIRQKIAVCRTVDGRILPAIRAEEEILSIVTENQQKSDRIPFFRATSNAFREAETVVVSFPGVHGKGWRRLTEVSQIANSPIVTSCVFLPDESAPGYGQHELKADGSCYCLDLYGKPEEWACRWFAKWTEQTLRAYANGCKLLVVTKMDGTLGR